MTLRQTHNCTNDFFTLYKWMSVSNASHEFRKQHNIHKSFSSNWPHRSYNNYYKHFYIEFQSLNHLASIYIVRNLCFIVCSCYESSKSSIISSEFMLNCFARNCPCHFMVIIALLFRLKRFFQSSHHGIFTLSLSYWPFLQSIKHSLFFTRFIVLSAFFFIITDCIHFQPKKKNVIHSETETLPPIRCGKYHFESSNYF